MKPETLHDDYRFGKPKPGELSIGITETLDFVTLNVPVEGGKIESLLLSAEQARAVARALNNCASDVDVEGWRAQIQRKIHKGN